MTRRMPLNRPSRSGTNCPTASSASANRVLSSATPMPHFPMAGGLGRSIGPGLSPQGDDVLSGRTFEDLICIKGIGTVSESPAYLGWQPVWPR